MLKNHIHIRSIIFVLVLLALIVMFLIFCNHKNITYVFSSDLSGQNVHLKSGSGLNITFPSEESDVQDNIILTDFTVTPGSGRIRIKYVEGKCNELLINLYDSAHNTVIMATDIKEGHTVSFKNLLSNHNYYFELIPNESMVEADEIDSIVMLVSP